MNRGYLQLLVLEALKESIHCYGLIKKLRALGYDMVEENTFYPLLRRFEKNGWVESEWLINDGQPQKIYSVSPLGISQKEQLYSIWKIQNETLKKVMEGSNE